MTAFNTGKEKIPKNPKIPPPVTKLARDLKRDDIIMVGGYYLQVWSIYKPNANPGAIIIRVKHKNLEGKKVILDITAAKDAVFSLIIETNQSL